MKSKNIKVTPDHFKGKGGELHQTAGADVRVLTTQQGTPVSDDQNTLRIGPRGPAALEDLHFREKVFHFDHERIPERVVHARGFGAHGFFENYKSLEDITAPRTCSNDRERKPRPSCVSRRWPATRRSESARGSMRLSLIAAQYAIALVLLTGSGLLVRSFLALEALTPGFDPHHLLTFTVDLPDGLYGEKARAIFDRAIEAIGHLPGVESASVGGTFHSHIPNGVITVEGRAPDDREPFTGWNVSPGYFKTIGLPLLRGRFFSN